MSTRLIPARKPLAIVPNTSKLDHQSKDHLTTALQSYFLCVVLPYEDHSKNRTLRGPIMVPSIPTSAVNVNLCAVLPLHLVKGNTLQFWLFFWSFYLFSRMNSDSNRSERGHRVLSYIAYSCIQWNAKHFNLIPFDISFLFNLWFTS